jgi:large subunit ribosomal protein L24e
MPVCSFCKQNYKEHKGLTVFSFDGKAIHYCSSKCRRNANLKRDPKKVNWIKRKKKGREAEDKKEILKEEQKKEQEEQSQEIPEKKKN